MLKFGLNVNVPAYHVSLKSKWCSVASRLSRELRVKMRETHVLARKNMKSCANRMKRNYALERNYEIGDEVYLLDNAVLKGKCRKLCPPWKGPGIAVSKLSAYIFRVKLLNAAPEKESFSTLSR